MSDCISCSTPEAAIECPPISSSLSHITGRDSQCKERMILPEKCSLVISTYDSFKIADGSEEEPIDLCLQEANSASAVVVQEGETIKRLIAPNEGDMIITSKNGRWTIRPRQEITPCFNPILLGDSGTGTYAAVFGCGEDGKLCLSKFTKPNCNLATDEEGKIVCSEKIGNCYEYSTSTAIQGDAIAIGVMGDDGRICLKFLDVPTDSKCFNIGLEGGKAKIISKPNAVDFKVNVNHRMALVGLTASPGITSGTNHVGVLTNIELNADVAAHYDTSKCEPVAAIIMVKLTFKQNNTASRGTFSLYSGLLEIMSGEARAYNSGGPLVQNSAMVTLPIIKAPGSPVGSVPFYYNMSAASKNFTITFHLCGFVY